VSRATRHRAPSRLLAPLARGASTSDRLAAALDAAVEATQAERGLLLEVQSAAGDGPGFEIRAARGFGREPLRASTESVSRTVVARVLRRGRGLVTTNVEDRAVTAATSVLDRRVLSILCVPVGPARPAKLLLYLDHRFVQRAFFALDLPTLEEYARELEGLLGFGAAEPAPEERGARVEAVGRLLAKVAARRDAAPDAAAHRLLLVSDQPYALEGLTGVLGSEPDLVVCGTANEPAQGVSTAAAAAPDLVIVDLLARGAVAHLIKDLRGRLPGAAVLVVASAKDHMHVERYLRAGARGCVLRERPIADVVAAVRAILSGADVHVAPEFTRRILGRLGPGGGASSLIDRLTDRELQVFDLLGRGLGTRRVAERLHLSVKTVETHRARIKAKLGLQDGAELARCAFEWAQEKPPG